MDVEWRYREGTGPWTDWEPCDDVADEVLAALHSPDAPEYVQTYYGALHYQWRLRPPGDLVGAGNVPRRPGPLSTARILP